MSSLKEAGTVKRTDAVDSEDNVRNVLARYTIR